MSLEIHLNNHSQDRVYHAGDTVSGVLHLKGPIKDPNLSITISLRGTSRAAIRVDKVTFTDIAKLFTRDLDIFNGPCYLSSKETMRFDFKFDFPHMTDQQSLTYREEVYLYRSDVFPWIGQHEVHPLPTSLSVEKFSYSGDIRYEVFALAKKSKRFSFDIKKCIELKLKERGDPRYLEFKQTALEMPLCVPKPKPGPQCRSLFGWFKDLLGCEGVPSGMALRVNAPCIINLDAVMPIELELVHLSSSEPPSQEVRFLDIKHEITRKTYIRAASCYESKSKSHEKNSTLWNFHKRKEGQQLKKLNRTLRLGETMDLTSELNLILSEDNTPLFRSYNISRWYLARTTVEVEFEGKIQVLKFPKRPLNVKPSLKRTIGRDQYLAWAKENGYKDAAVLNKS